MDSIEKNRFIVEKVLGECWHEWVQVKGKLYFKCVKCKRTQGKRTQPYDFYSTDLDEQAINFFRLWRAIRKEKWFVWNFLINHTSFFVAEPLIIDDVLESLDKLIDCAKLADAVVEYRGVEDVE